MKKGFTIVELLVVVGIIGILIAVLLGSMGGATDSARATKCQTNLHNLSAACLSSAMSSSTYPLAGSREVKKRDKGKNIFSEAKGWISWASMNAYRASPQSHQSKAAWFISTYDKSVEKRIYALTNGAIWKAISGNAATYLCPHHIQCAKRKKVDPVWSYVMNSDFGWDTTEGTAAKTSGGGIQFETLAHAERRLFLAELPFDYDNKAQSCSFSTGSGLALDPTLQHAKNEVIGFNHKEGKKWYAHVCFADGHIEKLELPKGAGKSQIQELTKWLCAGKDVSFNGKKYEEMK